MINELTKHKIETKLKIEKSVLAFSKEGLAVRLKRLGYSPEKRDSLDEKIVKEADKLILKHGANIAKAETKIEKLEMELRKLN